MRGHKISLHHTWNNSGLENKPNNNQQQLPPNQGNNFSVAPQQYSQQQQSASAPQQYQQPIITQQRANFVPTGQQNLQGVNPPPNVQQSSTATPQNQTLAERIANLQSGGLNQNENYYGQKKLDHQIY